MFEAEGRGPNGAGIAFRVGAAENGRGDLASLKIERKRIHSDFLSTFSVRYSLESSFLIWNALKRPVSGVPLQKKYPQGDLGVRMNVRFTGSAVRDTPSRLKGKGSSAWSAHET